MDDPLRATNDPVVKSHPSGEECKEHGPAFAEAVALLYFNFDGLGGNRTAGLGLVEP